MSDHVRHNVSYRDSSEKEGLTLTRGKDEARVRQRDIMLDEGKVCQIREAVKKKSEAQCQNIHQMLPRGDAAGRHSALDKETGPGGCR